MKQECIKLPFGEKNGKLVHISDVINGLACCCQCPHCHNPLIAAKGSKNQHHFRHYNSPECSNALESAIHKAAKHIIATKKKLVLPKLVAQYKGFKKEVVKPHTIIYFERIFEEEFLDGIRPDILGYYKENPLAIEIYYTHKCSEEKREFFKEHNISAIEINLSKVTWDELENWERFWEYINDEKNMEWLFNAKYVQTYQKLQHEFALKKDSIKSEIKRLQKITKTEKHKHPASSYIQDNFKCSFDALPDFVNVRIPHGDWIYGCDNTIWQSFLVIHFIYNRKRGGIFNLQDADNFLQKKANCTNPLRKKLRMYQKLYPEILKELNISASQKVSSWHVLEHYFSCLEKIGLIRRISWTHNDANPYYEVIS